LTPPASPVVILRWPEEAGSVDRLRAEGTPRLLLVAPDAAAPDVTACDEDWIRMPADDADVRARAATLASRAARHSPRPEVNGDGRIKFRSRWAPLSQTEEPLARALAEHFGDVLDRSMVEKAAWGDHQPSPNTVRVHITRLRRRIRPLGLVVRTVHGRGYVMESE
jgi:DNA-binding response OmpR family regulator